MEIVVTFAGTVTKTPEIRYLRSGLARTELEVTAERASAPDELDEGAPPTQTEILHVTAVGNPAENAALTFAPGVAIVGHGILRTRRVQHPADNAAHAQIEILATEFGPALASATAQVTPLHPRAAEPPSPEPATMRVVIMGPNRADGRMHVHRAGCADLLRNVHYAAMSTAWTVTVPSVRVVVEEIYAELLEEDPAKTWLGYRQDVKVFACAGDLPEEQ